MKTRRAGRLLCLGLALLLLLCGCGQGDADSPAPSGQQEKPNYPQADSIMPGGTAVLSVAGGTVDWQELYYWLVASLEMTQAESGRLPGWNEIVQKKTFEEFTKDDAAQAAALYRVVEQKAGEMGVTLSQAEEQALEDLKAQAVERLGSEEAYRDYLEENHLTEALQGYFQRVSALYAGLFAGYFGENGEKCTDTDAATVLEGAGYIQLKQLRADSREKAETWLEELKAAGDAAGERFDALLEEAAGSEGLFAPGQLDAGLETAAKALTEKGFSDVVESNGAYYIVLRLPIDLNQELEAGYTARHFAAALLFEDMVSEWTEQAMESAEYTEDFEKLSLKEVFGE